MSENGRWKTFWFKTYSKVHSPKMYRWWIAEKIIWPVFIREWK